MIKIYQAINPILNRMPYPANNHCNPPKCLISLTLKQKSSSLVKNKAMISPPINKTRKTNNDGGPFTTSILISNKKVKTKRWVIRSFYIPKVIFQKLRSNNKVRTLLKVMKAFLILKRGNSESKCLVSIK